MGYKIIQIIPFTRNFNAVFENDTQSPIVGLALVENENGDRLVEPIDITWDGEVEFPKIRADFIGLKEAQNALKGCDKIL